MAIAEAHNQMESYTINIPKMDLKRLKGIAKAMGWTVEKNNYYDSPEFYADIKKAEKDIEEGKGKNVNTIEELNAMFL